MARFNLDDYETVEQRIKRFYETHEDGRITTENLTDIHDRTVGTWVVKSYIYLTSGDQANNLPKATGLAFEVDGGNGANATAALENAETSSIGRALANAGFSGNKRTTREEMAKANRGVTPKSSKNWSEEADKITDIAGLRWLYAQAKNEGASAEVLERIEARGKVIGSGSEGQGIDGGLPISIPKQPKK
jgi:hypothetical protein